MPQAKFNVGESEKHEILVQSSYWTGQVKVDVDKKRIIDSYTLGFPKTLTFEVGENEKHEIKLDIYENNAFGYYIDDKFIRKVRVR